MIGRGRKANLRIQDRTISHKHCKIYLDENDGLAYLVDLGSSNGTYLNGDPQKLKKDEAVRLYSGDSISLVCSTNVLFVFNRL